MNEQRPVMRVHIFEGVVNGGSSSWYKIIERDAKRAVELSEIARFIPEKLVFVRRLLVVNADGQG